MQVSISCSPRCKRRSHYVCTWIVHGCSCSVTAAHGGYGGAPQVVHGRLARGECVAVH